MVAPVDRPAAGPPASTLSSRIERFIVLGPDPPDGSWPPTLLARVLRWPVRLFLTGAVWIVAFVWRASGPARPLAWALAYGGAIAVSLAASVWMIVFVLNAALGTAWLWGATRPPPSRDDRPLTWFVRHAIEFLNRQTSHFEVFWIWMAVVLTAVPRINYQLPLLAGIVLLAPPCINAFARWRHTRRRKGNAAPETPTLSSSDGTLQVARRSVIYFATLVGLVIVVARSLDSQFLNVVPLALAIGVGLGLRALRIRLRAHVRADDERVRAFRHAQMRWSRGPDVLFGPLAALSAIVALGGVATFGRSSLERARKVALDAQPSPSAGCASEQGGPVAADLLLFLVGDTHAHELGGQRFPGQTELADTVGNSALRPVELDVLSSAPIAQFARAFAALQAVGPSHSYWAHLGDLDDLSCTGELERARAAFAAFPADRFAGLAPGNHDVRFTGNFFWSPFWTLACHPGARVDKRTSIRSINNWIAESKLGEGLANTFETPASLRPGWLGGQPGALVTVTRLGALRTGPAGVERGVVALFIDSTDGQAFDWGLAGLYGTFSAAQAERLEAKVLALKAGQDKAYADPIFLVFSHHRLEDMTGRNASRLETFLEWLDRGGTPPVDVEPEPHLLAFVAAHTHVAETHRRCIGERVVRELVIGSAIDPPQQAAVLTVGVTAAGVPAARLQTLPSVARPGMTCGHEALMVDARACRQVLGALKAAPACEPLLREEEPRRDCSVLESLPSLREHLEAIALEGGVFEPDQIRKEQEIRTRNLMACVCRTGASGAGGPLCKSAAAGDQLENGAYAAMLEERSRLGGEEAERELVCLSWAAAAVQRDKTAGMTFAAALRCAFDDRTLPAAQDSVASLEVRRCR